MRFSIFSLTPWAETDTIASYRRRFIAATKLWRASALPRHIIIYLLSNTPTRCEPGRRAPPASIDDSRDDFASMMMLRLPGCFTHHAFFAALLRHYHDYQRAPSWRVNTYIFPSALAALIYCILPSRASMAPSRRHDGERRHRQLSPPRAGVSLSAAFMLYAIMRFGGAAFIRLDTQRALLTAFDAITMTRACTRALSMIDSHISA